MLHKTDQTGLYKDIESGAVINCDLQALNAYKKKKSQAKEMLDRQNRLENDVAEIKALLKSLLEKNNDN